MDTIKAIRKENYNYLEHNKTCNATDFALYEFYDFVESKEGRSEHENELLAILEREIQALRETIEAYKKELDNNHYKKIEELK